MASVEEPEQTSPNHSLISDNARWRYCVALKCVTRAYKCSVSTIHFGRGWSYWTWFLIKWDYFGNLTLFQNKYIPLLFLWWRVCGWVHCDVKKSKDKSIDFCHLHMSTKSYQSLTSNQLMKENPREGALK